MWCRFINLNTFCKETWDRQDRLIDTVSSQSGHRTQYTVKKMIKINSDLERNHSDVFCLILYLIYLKFGDVLVKKKHKNTINDNKTLKKVLFNATIYHSHHLMNTNHSTFMLEVFFLHPRLFSESDNHFSNHSSTIMNTSFL